MDQTYANTLRKYVTDPGSYSGSPGFSFARDQGLAALNSTNSRMRGSGNALAALVNYGTGVAQQDYGNEIDRLGKLTGQEQQYDLGQEQNRLTGARDANSYALGVEGNRLTGLRDEGNLALGHEQNATNAQRNQWDYSIAGRNADNTARANDQTFGLGMYRAGNDYNLGQQQNDNTAQNNWWNYNLGGQANQNTAARDANNFTTAQGQNGINWFNANTNRGAQQSDAYLGDQTNQRAWYSLNPPRRYG